MLHLFPSKALPFELPLVGEVEKLFTTYGFIATLDGHRFFFHFGTCTSKPEVLKVGDVVEFILGEDLKTHRLHAQKVRRIRSVQAATPPAPSTAAAAIISSLPPAAFFVSAQALLAVTGGLIPVRYPITATPIALPKVAYGLSYTTNPSTPARSVAKFTSSPSPPGGGASHSVIENCNIKRMPLRQISTPQRQENCQRRCEGGSAGPSWDGVLFKPFPVGGSSTNCNDNSSSDMAMAFERARTAWYSVRKN